MQMTDIAAAAEKVRKHDARTPEIAVILGSGLGQLVEAADETTVISTDQLPGYPVSTVEGHEGRIVLGRIEGRVVLFVQGRLHRYEGYAVHQVTFPVRLLHALRVRRLIITNAAGGINPNFVPGSLMFIRDHITLRTLKISLAENEGPADLGPREVYDPKWRRAARELALDLDIPSEQGVYAWTHGPNYETPAEVRAFAFIGADAVGMSTVPEALQAHRFGMKVLGVSMITNRAAGRHVGPLTHDEVLATAAQMHDTLAHLVRRIIGMRYAA